MCAKQRQRRGYVEKAAAEQACEHGQDLVRPPTQRFSFLLGTPIALVIAIVTSPFEVFHFMQLGNEDETGIRATRRHEIWCCIMACLFIVVSLSKALAEVCLATKARRKLCRRLEHSFNRFSRVKGASVRAGMECAVKLAGIAVSVTPQGGDGEMQGTDNPLVALPEKGTLEAANILTVSRSLR